MKKSLSLILAIAMVFSMFASVAFAADASLDTTAKYEELKKAGIFEGTDGDKPALEENMTRAQFAKVIVILLGLKEDAASASIFNDLAGAGWASGFIGAAVKAGLVDGVAPGKFDPSANVTTEQLAKLLVIGLKLQQTTDGVTGTVSDWAKGYVGAAVKAGLIPASSDYTNPALRGALVDATYAAKPLADALNAPAKVSVTEAKATGVYQVTVKFNKEVDTAKAKLSLKKGDNTVGATAKFADDKKSATLALDTKISAGEYTVTLSGLDAAEIDVASAKFTAEDEKVTKIEFVSASDTIAYSENATISLKALNQYGEASTLSGSNYKAIVAGDEENVKRNDDGTLVIEDIDTTDGGENNQGLGVIPVTVYLTDTNVTVTKNFNLGIAPQLSKIEVGEVEYEDGNKSLVDAGDEATVPLTLLDQYGNVIVKEQFEAGLDGETEIKFSSINPVITPYEEKLEVKADGGTDAEDIDAAEDLFDDEDNARIIVTLTDKLDANGDYTLSIYGSAASSSATIKVGAAKTAAKLAFGKADVLSADDSEAIVELIATDANGNTLTADEIYDDYEDGRYEFNASKADDDDLEVVRTGSDKGKLKITFDSAIEEGDVIYVSAQIEESKTNTYVQTTISVVAAAAPERIVVDEDVDAKAIAGADSELVYLIKDQYGDDIDNFAGPIEGKNGDEANYQVRLTVTNDNPAGIQLVPQDADLVLAAHLSNDGDSVGDKTVYEIPSTLFEEFNEGFDVTTDGTEGKITVKAVIEKQDEDDDDFSAYSSAISRSLEVIAGDTDDLTYSLDTIGNLYAAIDNLKDNVDDAATSPYNKEVEVIAKDKSGDEVALPGTIGVTSLSVSNSSVLKKSGAFILGDEAGTATVTAVVYTNTGKTITLKQDVTVKADAIEVASIEADEDEQDVAPADIANGVNGNVITFFENITVEDNYGVEYEFDADDLANNEILDADEALGIRYTVEVLTGTGTVTVDAETGAFTINGSVEEFVVTATAPNGKSVEVLVY